MTDPMGELSERDFAAFKRDVLISAEEDVPGVYQAWWAANGWFPGQALSTRLGLAERALAELLSEGLIRLVRDEADPDGSEIPRSECEAVLREWAVWTWEDEEQRAFFVTTPAGTEAVGRPA